MADRPLPIVLALVQNAADELLLVRREHGDFSGYWGFPGGKVERDEFIAEAIQREVHEETGIETAFEEHRGVVSEHVYEGNELVKHVPLHICYLTPTDDAQEPGDNSDWFSLADIRDMRDETVPSLVPIADTFLTAPDRRYRESVIRKEDGTATLERFK